MYTQIHIWAWWRQWSVTLSQLKITCIVLWLVSETLKNNVMLAISVSSILEDWIYPEFSGICKFYRRGWFLLAWDYLQSVWDSYSHKHTRKHTTTGDVRHAHDADELALARWRSSSKHGAMGWGCGWHVQTYDAPRAHVEGVHPNQRQFIHNY
jgi:hypothetical protein